MHSFSFIVVVRTHIKLILNRCTQLLQAEDIKIIKTPRMLAYNMSTSTGLVKLASLAPSNFLLVSDRVAALGCLSFLFGFLF